MTKGWVVALCAMWLVGCDAAEPEPDPQPASEGSVVSPEFSGTRDALAREALFVRPDEVDFAANPRLLVRLREHSHNYLRFIRAPFAAEVCQRFGSRGVRSPQVNLHGDAHLEQYAVTDLGRGLTDYDGATFGPVELDLVRMGTSIRLTCQIRGWAREESLIDALLASYRSGIIDSQQAPEPRIIRRMREGFSNDRAHQLDVSEGLAERLSAGDTDKARGALRAYFQSQLTQDSSLDRRFFDLVSIGRLDMGIGSALDEKYLLRVRGPSDRSEDDEILEAKQVHSVADIPCANAAAGTDPFRILIGESRMAYRPFPYLGYIRTDTMVFWVHGWTTNYLEVSVLATIDSVEELEELVMDIGRQLGRGHVNRIAAPLDGELRRAVLAYVREQEPLIRHAVVEMTQRTQIAWEHFVEVTRDHPALNGRRSRRSGVFDDD